ncbi:MAG TPA: polysaccharide deacetylase family protein [Thermodesulfovibrionales bacterium]|nr:polysaccharide deacetylase family protein [Thermodesulfovibrionales bacterium]
MWYLKAAGFVVVPLHEIMDFGGTDARRKKVVALTFDDGYEDFYVNAFPVLEKYGYPATVFVVSDLVGTTNAWDENSLGIRKQLMAWDRIRALSSRNVFFGSHTRTHPFLTRIEEQRAREEIDSSKKIIEEQTRHVVETFCYPYGDRNNAVKRMVREAGYKVAVTTDRGSVHREDDPLTLRRAFIRYNTHPIHFLQKLHTGYEDRKGRRT